MISSFSLSNQKSPDEIQTLHEASIPSSINKIKNDEVKLLRERLAVMQKRAKQRQQQLVALRQHMEMCQNLKAVTVNQQDLKFCDDFVQEQNVKGFSSNLQPDSKKSNFQEKKLCKQQTFKISDQVQIVIKPEKSTQKPQDKKFSQQDKLLMYTLQTKLQSYEKKHLIFQQTLNQRTQEFQKEIQKIKQKLKEQKKFSNQLGKKCEELEQENISLRQELEEICHMQDESIEPYKESLIVGVQTDVQKTKNLKLTYTRLYEVKINPFVNKNSRKTVLRANRRVLSMKIQPNLLYQKPNKSKKLFIFSQQVHQKVQNIKNQSQITNTPKYRYNLDQDVPIRNQNFNILQNLEQNKTEKLPNLGYRSRYRSLTNLGVNMSTKQQSCQTFDMKNHNKIYENLNPLGQIKNLENLTKMAYNPTQFKQNLWKRQNNRDMIPKRNYDENFMRHETSVQIKPGFNFNKDLKSSSLTIRQSLKTQIRPSNSRIQPSSSQELKKTSNSLSVKDLIVQKCRQNLKIN